MVALAESRTDAGNSQPERSDATGASYATETVAGDPRVPLHATLTLR
jgi:hypothetical protein